MGPLNGKSGLTPKPGPKIDVYPGEIVTCGERSGSF